MKKQKQKKAGVKKEDKQEAPSAYAKADDSTDTAQETAPAATNRDNDAEVPSGDSKDQEDTVPEPNSEVPQRQPSLSLQSKMRSSSFRQSSGGPLSPSYGFSPDGDTAPEIYRKQASRIEELEKENKRLAKEADDGERRWKKAEEELEDMREADDDSATKGANTASSPGSPNELEKLVGASKIR